MIKNVADSVCAIELDKSMQEGIRADGIQCYASIDELQTSHPDLKFDVITMFGVLEHLQYPVEILKSLSQLLSANGKVVVQIPNADDALLSLYKCTAFADFTYWICHLYLYSNRTLPLLVEKAGLKLKFIQQMQRYPLANHLYWLSQGKPRGHQEWACLCDGFLDKTYGDKLARLGIADTIIAVIET